MGSEHCGRINLRLIRKSQVIDLILIFVLYLQTLTRRTANGDCINALIGSLGLLQTLDLHMTYFTFHLHFAFSCSSENSLKMPTYDLCCRTPASH